MNIFFGILAVAMFILLEAEKNDCKRKHLTWGFIAVIGAMATVNIFTLIF
jgi:hypothetical protein